MSDKLDPEETPHSRLARKIADQENNRKKIRAQFPDEVYYEQNGNEIIKKTKVFEGDENGKKRVRAEYSTFVMKQRESNKEEWKLAIEKIKNQKR